MAMDLMFENEYAGDRIKILCDASVQVQDLIFLSPTLWEAYYFPTDSSCPCILTNKWLRMSHITLPLSADYFLKDQ